MEGGVEEDGKTSRKSAKRGMGLKEQKLNHKCPRIHTDVPGRKISSEILRISIQRD
jgi:hypothetical protein